MGLTERKARTVFSVSAIFSLIGFVTTLATRLSKVSILIAAALFLLLLPVLWIIQRPTRPGKALLVWMQSPGFAQIGFLFSLSVLSSGLGFILWIFLFASGSLVREGLIQLSPVIGWGVGVAIYLLAVLGAVLNADGEKRDGLLIGSILFSVIGHLFLFWLTAQIFSFTIDDAYITFRYSKNLADGFGPTYNPGLPSVEGYTTFLWMLLMTLPHYINVNVATFAKLSGIILTCGTFTLLSLLTFTLARQFPVKARLFFSAFAVYLLALLPTSAVHAIAGMETSLFIFLLVLMVTMLAVGLLNNSRLLFWSPLVGLGIGMTRPEGNAIVLLLLAFGWYYSAAESRRRLVRSSLLFYILPGALYFLWRSLYYDLLLPLPFYMKVLHGSGLFGGANEVGSYLLALLPGISVLLLVGLLHLRKEQFAILIPVTFLLIFYLFPVHAMGFNWRFLYPATPFICILAAIGGIAIFDFLRGQIRSHRPWELPLLAGLLLVGLGNLSSLDGMIRAQNSYGAGISNYKAFGTLLSEYNNQHELTLAIGDAGTVPYYSDWQVIDLFGLNSKEVAFGSVPLFKLVFEQQPVDLILLSVGANPNRISDEHAGAQNLYDEAVRNGMARLGSFPFGREGNIWVLGYSNTQLGAYLLEQIEFEKYP